MKYKSDGIHSIEIYYLEKNTTSVFICFEFPESSVIAIHIFKMNVV